MRETSNCPPVPGKNSAGCDISHQKSSRDAPGGKREMRVYFHEVSVYKVEDFGHEVNNE